MGNVDKNGYVEPVELVQKLNKLTETVNALKEKVEVVYRKGYAEVSFGSLFDIDNSTQNNDLTEVINELRNDFNALKQDLDNLKVSGGVDFSLYNKVFSHFGAF